MSFSTRLPPVLLLLRNMSKKSPFNHFPGKALEYFVIPHISYLPLTFPSDDTSKNLTQVKLNPKLSF